MDEGVVRRWMGLELHRINQGVVQQPLSLDVLRAMDAPAVRTRGGALHPLDADALERFAAGVPAWLHRRVRLPLVFYAPHDMAGEVYLQDAAGIEALEALEALPADPVGGRAWMGLARLQGLQQRFPGLVQVFRL